LGRVVFKSGQSLGSGLTAVLQEAYDINGNRYIDTPGLSDVKKSERAAIEIEKALKKGGLFKIFFVITLESGRIRPDDINTIRLVLGAVSSINSCYSIIINKSQPEVLMQTSFPNSFEISLKQDRCISTHMKRELMQKKMQL
jgi:hypothetical protein